MTEQPPVARGVTGAIAYSEMEYGQIAAALAKAQAAYPEVKKSKEVTITQRNGGQFKFSYAPLDAILDAVRKPLSDNGLAITQVLDGPSIITRLMHESGEYLEGTMPVPRGEDIKALGASITYLRRYALQAMLGIAAEEDTDGPQDGPAAQPTSKPLATAVSDRLRDTGSPAAPPPGPRAVPDAPASPEAAPEAPEDPDEAAAPPEETDPAATDPAEVPAADDGKMGLTFEEFRKSAREKGMLTGYVVGQARTLWPNGVFTKQQDIEDLSDEDRFKLMMACLANA